MATENVGAGILNIITESLYDKPIVVFREYAQNSADSFNKLTQSYKGSEEETLIHDLESHFWFDEEGDLFFLDNGKGIEPSEFRMQMETIARSSKKKTSNIGYKGIGRLSGISYCEKLQFINICSLENSDYQSYSFDCLYYNKLKNSSEYNHLSFDELISKIGSFEDKSSFHDHLVINKILERYNHLFSKRDTGFLVIMKKINLVLERAIQDSNFLNDISWLLPVTFKQELLEAEKVGELFKELSTENEMNVTPAKCYNFFFNESKVERPISLETLRSYTCKVDLTYAIGIIDFNSNQISIKKGNLFSGIRIYIDNMLLCDENEFLPILSNLGLIDHSANELIQSTRGIGAIIYITDKTSISTNARRTFIEVADASSIEFLTLLAEFVKKIYNARYALSKYSSFKKKIINDNEESKEKLNNLKTLAAQTLSELAKEKIVLNEQFQTDIPFQELSLTEKKATIKKFITKQINSDIQEYLKSVTDPKDYTNSYDDYITWVSSKYHQ
ncbi:MAG: ATP-binding protein [Candidatus Izemoplasmatales bacterium]|nr:ATP-binding protein [Candidatus Izemoplasmatales bacterium]